MDITKEQFQTFVDIRDIGITNMLNIPAVVEASGGELNEEEVVYIIEHFKELWNKYAS